MKQAILITAYKNIYHLEEIISCFDSDFYFYIHLDKKSNLSPNEKHELEKIENIAFVSRNFKTNWGGLNHLNSILLLLKEAIKNKDIEYIHLISGHDFPIKSCQNFKEIMLANKGKEFLEFFDMPAKVWENGGMDRMLYYNLYDIIDAKGANGRLIKKLIGFQKKYKITRKIKDDFPKLFGGSTWWTLSFACCQCVLSYIDKNPSFLKRFKYTFCAEEIFFQTIILNSPFKENVVNDNQRLILWETRNGNCPANLDESDLNTIAVSEKLFARRFEYPISASLVKTLKEQLTKQQL